MVFHNDANKLKLLSINLNSEVEAIYSALETWGVSGTNKKFSDVGGNTTKIIEAVKNCDVTSVRNYISELSESEAARLSNLYKSYGSIQNITTVYFREIPDRLHDGVFLLSYGKVFLLVHIYEYKTNSGWIVDGIQITSDTSSYLKYMADYSTSVKKFTK
jgi:hypothetical protein